MPRRGVGAGLEDRELFGRRSQVAGEFDFDRPAETLAADFEHSGEDVRQRKDVGLQHVGERDEPHARAVNPVIQGVVLRRPYRSDRGQRAVAFGHAQIELDDGRMFDRRDAALGVAQVDRIKETL